MCVRARERERERERERNKKEALAEEEGDRYYRDREYVRTRSERGGKKGATPGRQCVPEEIYIKLGVEGILH